MSRFPYQTLKAQVLAAMRAQFKTMYRNAKSHVQRTPRLSQSRTTPCSDGSIDANVTSDTQITYAGKPYREIGSPPGIFTSATRSPEKSSVGRSLYLPSGHQIVHHETRHQAPSPFLGGVVASRRLDAVKPQQRARQHRLDRS